MIHPCPFSKGYGIPEKQAWSSLSVFALYRFIIASLFVMLFFGSTGPSLLGASNAPLYIFSSLGYLLVSVIAGTTLFIGYPRYTTQVQLLIFTDIIFITLLMHASGGVTSGIGILLAVPIAASGLLIGGRCAVVFAAMASVTLLSEQIYSHQTFHGNTAYTFTGMLGASLFAIALLSLLLAQRAEQSDRVAEQRKKTIIKLEELNHYIIQHLQSGIVIVGDDHAISMFNEAALRLLDLQILPQQLDDISPLLVSAFSNWQQNSERDTATLQVAHQNDIQVRFKQLPIMHETIFMIILEDTALYNQRVQQSKLVSLGRLTASIAHEIRNPIGAIGHAVQLLSEHSALAGQEKRLAEIIQTQTLRVNQIIEDILHLSKRAASHRESVELVSWLPAYLQQFCTEHVIDEDLFELQTNAAIVKVLIDPAHLKQILDNLCQNALKYGAKNTTKIIIRATFRQQPRNHHLEVIDHGMGIDKENSKHLFEPFFTTSATGTGLGLYISRELAELNQAELSYHAMPHAGNCFRLSIPDAESKIIEI